MHGVGSDGAPDRNQEKFVFRVGEKVGSRWSRLGPTVWFQSSLPCNPDLAEICHAADQDDEPCEAEHAVPEQSSFTLHLDINCDIVRVQPARKRRDVLAPGVV